jgi:hypothetical protein
MTLRAQRFQPVAAVLAAAVLAAALLAAVDSGGWRPAARTGVPCPMSAARHAGTMSVNRSYAVGQ